MARLIVANGTLAAIKDPQSLTDPWQFFIKAAVKDKQSNDLHTKVDHITYLYQSMS